MFTQPKIVTPKKQGERAYVTFYYNGKRLREYNGNRLNLVINPNQCSTIRDQKRVLTQLQFEFTKALNAGWNPFAKLSELPSLQNALAEVLAEKLSSNLCDLYKRNLKAVCRMFVEFVPKIYLNDKCDSLPLSVVDAFLAKFQSSERNYINRRRCLSTLINEFVRKGYASFNVVKSTKPARAKACLHIPYSKDQLNTVLEFLETTYPNLHLCCILTYGCLLRPHHEIRLLKIKHFVKDFSQIQLSGSENKSKRIRTVYIPLYIKVLLEKRLDGISDKELNIFTLTKEPYSVGYFNLMWGKAKTKMIKAKLLEPNQTIYSFRHTAAIGVYQKTKDLHVLQQLLQHSNMIVTLNYLRGLGEINDERLKDVLPEL
ncbi:site-specific integrase [Pedobacter endophyticus]|uniref:Site-specific integrase n=1 Tax=Pedobacter endophyticus TaxID=2789740 RepID=A0A7U3Q582_9SPHI|nr:site-specific integrase [Pedobacter endophyticus]QPH37910.1 site-specific integrase [Pedobacter endophyticus]